MRKQFRIYNKGTQDHWLEIEGTDGGVVIDGKKETPIWNMKIVAKWDGCVLYDDFSNGYSWNHKCDDECQTTGCCQQNLHICDIDDMIDTLQQVKKIAIEFFKDKGGEEYWK